MQQKRVTGAKECTWTSFGSLSPPKCHIFRQKSAKINFGMSLLHKIIGEAGQEQERKALGAGGQGRAEGQAHRMRGGGRGGSAEVEEGEEGM